MHAMSNRKSPHVVRCIGTFSTIFATYSDYFHIQHSQKAFPSSSSALNLNLYMRFRLIIDFNTLKDTSQILNEFMYIKALEVRVYPAIIIANLFLLSFYADLIETC